MASFLRRHYQRRSPEVRFGLQLTLGAVTLLAAGWIFGEIAENVVTRDLITVVDQWLAEWLHRHTTSTFTRAMLLVTGLAGPLVVSAVSLATALCLIAWRRWHWLLALVLVVPGGALFSELLKIVFQRARPTFDTPLVTVPGYSFPSGHTMLATLLYGFVALLLFRPVRRWRWRAAAAGGAALVIPLVAVSRMYLGAHYLSDTLAAIAAGIFWLALCLTAVAALRWQRRPADDDVAR